MLPGEAIPRAPSLHRGGALPGASVLASKEATPPQGGRGEGRQKAWLLGVISRPDPNAGRARPGRWLAIAPDEQSSRRMETSVAGERGDGSLARGVGFLTQVRAPNADRGGSLARRRIHGSRACPRVDHALQISVGNHKPREARLKAVGSLMKVRERRPLQRRSERRAASGQAGARSRVSTPGPASQGVGPGRSRRRSDCRSDRSVDVHGVASASQGAGRNRPSAR